MTQHVHLALILAFSTGSFLAPATLLPSTFAMYCMTAATTGVLRGSRTVCIMSSMAIWTHVESAGQALCLDMQCAMRARL